MTTLEPVDAPRFANRSIAYARADTVGLVASKEAFEPLVLVVPVPRPSLHLDAVRQWSNWNGHLSLQGAVVQNDSASQVAIPPAAQKYLDECHANDRKHAWKRAFLTAFGFRSGPGRGRSAEERLQQVLRRADEAMKHSGH